MHVLFIRSLFQTNFGTLKLNYENRLGTSLSEATWRDKRISGKLHLQFNKSFKETELH